MLAWLQNFVFSETRAYYTHYLFFFLNGSLECFFFFFSLYDSLGCQTLKRHCHGDRLVRGSRLFSQRDLPTVGLLPCFESLPIPGHPTFKPGRIHSFYMGIMKIFLKLFSSFEKVSRVCEVPTSHVCPQFSVFAEPPAFGSISSRS